MQNPSDLADLLSTADFHSLSVVRSGERWQANLQRERGNNSFRVEFGDTAAEAIAALFAPAPVFVAALPPCPIPLPVCPVALP